MSAHTSHRQAPHGTFQRFVHSEVSGSVVLLACTVAALIWANSPWAQSYLDLTHHQAGVSWGESRFSMSLQHWINDGLMVLFFFVVGLEIKREILVGGLSTVDRAVLPVGAALGGMIIPAGLFVAFNLGGPGQAGWGVPMATDIAFALGVLALFGKRVPLALKLFLTAAAIADDLGAVLVIALFYTETINLVALAGAGMFMALLALACRFGVRRIGVLFLLIVGVWVGVFASGVHATVAGILVALMMPVRARRDPREALATVRESVEALGAQRLSRESMLHERSQLDTMVDLNAAARDMTPVGISLEGYFHPVQAFLVLPLFAFFNAGVPLGEDIFTTLLSPVALGICVGLFLGKQIGLTAFTWLVVRSGRATLPEGVSWGQIWGTGCIAGIGFTMSLFITDLAFQDEILANAAKVGILAASALSALVGAWVLHRTLPRQP